MAKRHYSSEMNGHYEGHVDRRRQEMMDAGMIHEDHSAIANMPQEVMIKSYPKSGYGLEAGLDDSIRGVDKQIDLDGSLRSKNNVPKKV